MTAVSRLLEDFVAARSDDVSGRWVTDDEWEERRLSGYEEGYSAGWEDALSAQSKSQALLCEALGQRLCDLSFTYHEALTQMLAALEPVFQAIFETVLPRAWAMGQAARLTELAMTMARERAEGPIVLTVPEGTANTIRPAFEREYGAPFELREDPGLAPDQACIRLGDAEQFVDGEALLRALSDAVDGFVLQMRKDDEHE
ncbi:ABC transporter ATP-binding protein [Jhaorihella thermophila]|uniref:Flagellar assembly protein FliH n=1 Tax=Jhaorihella thermophila TaxID=488547 RepID=A0A1H5XFV0_9RHOB|nr:ABC transporter ATP-binding protein [Jhaorihella thermophila]SEG10694.1 flagellar assembly protein FliH [Jhaorihella thermophila]